jgi:hypothetical protein
MKIGLAPAAAAPLLALAVFFAPSTAFAQTNAPKADYVERKVDDGVVVTFGDDGLDGDPDDPYGGVVKPPPPIIRAGLIRPRVNFVSELLKSVESL